MIDCEDCNDKNNHIEELEFDIHELEKEIEDLKNRIDAIKDECYY